jgi:hypothetical protein
MMELKHLIIEPAAKTPLIDMNWQTGELILSGRSIPENAVTVFNPVLNWVKEYCKNPKPTTKFRINLEYFNTSSSIWLAKILKGLSQINNPDYILMIHLYLNIEDFDELDGESLKDELVPFTDIIPNAIPSVGIRIYGTDSDGKIIKETVVFI